MINADATPNGMNDDDNNNNNNNNNNNKNHCSSSDDHIGDGNINQGKQSGAWGTWEELLLACAVKRHGFRDWDSVAMEVQSRSSLPRLLTTAQNCKQKYRDLKRRFQERPTEDDGDREGKSDTEVDGEDKVDNIPWLEHLRSLRVEELRRELQRFDVSILSLQLKVKKLEEERERSVGDQKPDLDEDSKGERSKNDETQPMRLNSGKAVTAAEEEESDQENRSINESNSTASGGKLAGDGDVAGPVRDNSGNLDPVPVCKAAAEEGSVSRGSEVSHSGELGESGGFGRTWKMKGRTNRSSGGGGGGGEMRWVTGKSEPLISFLDMIRAHPRGSLFERRLRSQEMEDYKSLVRQHLDLETVQKKLDQGSYSSSTLSFYRDLHLLFTNAIVFFPNSSSESLAAHELRTLVSNKTKEETGKPGPTLDRTISFRPRGDTSLDVKPDPETSDSSLTRQKSSAPLVACRRSSVSTKPSPSSSFSQKAEKKSEEVSGEKGKIVTGVRSSRRTNKGVSAVVQNTKTGSATTSKKPTSSKTNSPNDKKQEAPKTNKKTLASDKKKSVADFLKRIKNSPANSPKKGGNTGKDQNTSGGNGKKDTKAKQSRSNNVAKKKAEEDNTPLRRSTGRQQKKAAADEAVASSGKRGRETSKDNKQPRSQRLLALSSTRPPLSPNANTLLIVSREFGCSSCCEPNYRW